MAVLAYTNDLTDWIPDSTITALQGANIVSQSTNTTNLFLMGRFLGFPGFPSL